MCTSITTAPSIKTRRSRTVATATSATHLVASCCCEEECKLKCQCCHELSRTTTVIVITRLSIPPRSVPLGAEAERKYAFHALEGSVDSARKCVSARCCATRESDARACFREPALFTTCWGERAAAVYDILGGARCRGALAATEERRCAAPSLAGAAKGQ